MALWYNLLNAYIAKQARIIHLFVLLFSQFSDDPIWGVHMPFSIQVVIYNMVRIPISGLVYDYSILQSSPR